jgi:hypothetical protein
MYGPLVLAGLSNTATFVPDAASPSDAASFITRGATVGVLNFTARGKDVVGKDVVMAMIPLFEVMEEKYCVYFRTTTTSDVPYSAGGAVVPSQDSSDWEFDNAG